MKVGQEVGLFSFTFSGMQVAWELRVRVRSWHFSTEPWQSLDFAFFDVSSLRRSSDGYSRHAQICILGDVPTWDPEHLPATTSGLQDQPDT